MRAQEENKIVDWLFIAALLTCMAGSAVLAFKSGVDHRYLAGLVGVSLATVPLMAVHSIWNRST